MLKRNRGPDERSVPTTGHRGGMFTRERMRLIDTNFSHAFTAEPISRLKPM